MAMMASWQLFHDEVIKFDCAAIGILILHFRPILMYNSCIIDTSSLLFFIKLIWYDSIVLLPLSLKLKNAMSLPVWIQFLLQ